MYKLNEEKMFFDVADDQAIVINFVTGMYYGTSMLGSVVLERLVKGNDPKDIARAVHALPGCPEDFDAEMEQFLAELREKEILVPGETTPGGDAPLDGKAASEGFVLTLDEFAEVQDLILADPIHDVDVEQGWPIFREDE